MKAKLLKSEGVEIDIDLPEDDTERYQVLSDMVQGTVSQHILRSGKIMYYNEDGKFLGLGINFKASSIAMGVINANEYVVGNVVVVEPKT